MWGLIKYDIEEQFLKLSKDCRGVLYGQCVVEYHHKARENCWKSKYCHTFWTELKVACVLQEALQMDLRTDLNRR